MTPLFLIAEIRPKPEHYKSAVEAVASIVDQTRQEPGCRDFRLFENHAEGRFFLFEEWDDEEDLTAHYDQPYTRKVFAAYSDWLVEEPTINKMTAVR